MVVCRASKKIMLSSLVPAEHVISLLYHEFFGLFTTFTEAWLDKRVLSSLVLELEVLRLLLDLLRQASKSLSWKRTTLQEADAP
jgi:hypothetical protein